MIAQNHSRRGMRFLLFALVLLVLTACRQHYDRGPLAVFPETVSPIPGANSKYDDMNAPASRTYNMVSDFFFSSNRATQGDTFDIESMELTFTTKGGEFIIEAQPPMKMWPGTNTAGNEYGPAIWGDYYTGVTYLYASDSAGNLDIYHVSDGVDSRSEAINSAYDDAYPTITNDNSTIYFTSNREGKGVFDIYRAAIPDGSDIASWLATAVSTTVEKVTVLSSVQDDKCPAINGNVLVFTSNRTGGYGGYDLYYSTYGPDGWSAPENFGQAINTEYNEYRPIVIDSSDYSNNLMIFSSDRPGGDGGYDLYYVGIPQMVK